MDSGYKTVVIDPGTDTMKAGFNDREFPDVVFPNLIEKTNNALFHSEPEEYVGEEAPLIDGDMVEHPVAQGLVAHWDSMEKVLKHTFNDRLNVNPNEVQVLVTENPLNTRYNKERLAQIMFETFEVPALYLKNTAVLSLYHAGRTSGTVVESGDSVTQTSVVNEDRVITHTIPKTFYAGKDVDEYLLKLMERKGFILGSNNSTERCIREMKENVCFVSDDYNNDLKCARTSNEFTIQYEMPSGEVFTVNEERFKCAEGLFHPERFGRNCPGIHKQVNTTLQLAGDKFSQFTYSNIVLAGGNTMFPGFAARLKRELDQITEVYFDTNIIERPERKFAAWIGGSVMTCLDSMKTQWITKMDYHEYGPSAVYKKH